MEDTWAKKFRKITVSLILSGALNIGLIAAFVALVLQDRVGQFSSPQKKWAEEQKSSNIGALHAMSKLSFRELVALLTNRESVEQGYAKRDLAIAALTAFHHFNLEKALGTAPLQKRSIAVNEGEAIDVFPGLTEEQFEGIIRFAYQEKWPLTSKGLFSLLQKLSTRDESLEQAFAITPEFYAVQLLFQKTDAPQDASTLIHLLSEGSWDLLDCFVKEQSQLLDFSVEKRRRLLLSYLAHHSKTAAHLLLKTDGPFVLKRLDDRGILDVLTLLDRRTEEAAAFCSSLLQSPRGDAVWQAATQKLYAFAGEPMPETFDAKTTLSHFGLAKSEAKLEPKPAPVAAQQPAAAARYHTVKEGESLWKIARQYKVKPEDVAKTNGLDRDKIFPGMTLKIPTN
ncbi:MAG: LysM peptidoglycan-binding domain-containing protein [Verrucomicrobiota bacterium]|nr:LysM peptidoglycan-binding domain-containing protein [Verrucomicrobiota bacterium]